MPYNKMLLPKKDKRIKKQYFKELKNPLEEEPYKTMFWAWIDSDNLHMPEELYKVWRNYLNEKRNRKILKWGSIIVPIIISIITKVMIW
jgi:hypothetical protein